MTTKSPTHTAVTHSGEENGELPEFDTPPTLVELVEILREEQVDREDPLDQLRALRELRNFIRANEGPMIRIAREHDCNWEEIAQAIGFQSVIEAQMILSDEGGTP